MSFTWLCFNHSIFIKHWIHSYTTEEEKNKEEKKPNTTLFKNWFLFEKKKILCYGGRTFGSISPLWQSVTINIHQGFHRHAKKNCPSQNGRRWHWCFLQSDRLASASTCSSKTEILCQHYAKDRWTNEATIMYSVTDQQKTNEFDSQMKKKSSQKHYAKDRWTNGAT